MPAKPLRILIVEDDPDVRSYLTNLLHAHGYRVLAADNVVQALRLARTESPALMVLDALLPNDDIQRLYVDLKTAPATKRIPVIALSSLTRRTIWTTRLHSASRSARRLPEPDVFLANPPEAEEFLTAIAHLVNSPIPNRLKEDP